MHASYITLILNKLSL